MQTDTVFTSTPTDQLVLRIVNALKVQLEAMLPFPMADHPAPEALMTAIQTADWLQFSLPTLHKLTKQQIIPCIRIGCNVRYRKSDILKYLTQARTSKHNKSIIKDST
jgi:predicted DNA-binding transcriptional regulator AlpA